MKRKRCISPSFSHFLDPPVLIYVSRQISKEVKFVSIHSGFFVVFLLFVVLISLFALFSFGFHFVFLFYLFFLGNFDLCVSPN